MRVTLTDGIRGLWRLGQTARVLGGVGMEWVLGDRPPAPQLLRRTFERLGATYIKLGQFIASSPSLFPPEYVREFQSCLDQTEPVPFPVMETVLRREFRCPLHDIYAAIDPEPLACASIAQVHTAHLVNGEEVVIKIRKPGVKSLLASDLNFLYAGARALELIAPRLTHASLSAVVEEIQTGMMAECDFLREAENIRAFDRFLRATGNERVIVPCVYEHATTLRVLTMERLYGVALTDEINIRRYVSDPEDTLITAMNTWFASVLMGDFFHADLHAGNLMVLEDGRIGFIDFGIVGRIEPAIWRATAVFFDAFGAQDYFAMAQAMVALGVTAINVNTQELAQDLKKLFDDFNDLTADVEKAVDSLLLEVTTVGKRHGIRFPRAFALLLKQFLYFDRYIRILAPDLDVLGDERLRKKMNPAHFYNAKN